MDENTSTLEVKKDFHYKKSPSLAPALISLHPQQRIVVIAIGSALRVFSLEQRCPVQLKDETSPSRHGDAIRSLAFDSSGNFFASGGDDKLLKLWKIEKDWICLFTVRVVKKITCILFSKDSKWIIFSDKYGSVGILPTSFRTSNPLPEPNSESNQTHETTQPTVPYEPTELLAHCCCIITSMDISFDGKYIATGDRDSKIRVSLFPSNPVHGAYDIESYCLGHSHFVTCLKFLNSKNNFLVSGGGDGTIRLWDSSNGELLDTLFIANMEKKKEDATSSHTNAMSSHEESKRAIIDLSTSHLNPSMIFAIIDQSSEIFVINCDFDKRKLSLHQKIFLGENEPPPTSIFSSPLLPPSSPSSPSSPHFDHLLWSISGAAECLEGKDGILSPEELIKEEEKAHAISSSAYVRILLLKNKSHLKFKVKANNEIGNGKSSGNEDGENGTTSIDFEYELVEEREEVGLGGKEMEFLQGCSDESKVLAMVKTLTLLAEESMVSELSKRTFTQEEREKRKKGRSDKK